MLKKVFQKLRAYREKKYWEKRQLQHLRDLIRGDIHWMGTEGIHGTLLKRYWDALDPQWYQKSFTRSDLLREELVNIPDDSKMGYLTHYVKNKTSTKPKMFNPYGYKLYPVCTPADLKKYDLPDLPEWPGNHVLVGLGPNFPKVGSAWVREEVLTNPGLLDQLIEELRQHIQKKTAELSE